MSGWGSQRGHGRVFVTWGHFEYRCFPRRSSAIQRVSGGGQHGFLQATGKYSTEDRKTNKTFHRFHNTFNIHLLSNLLATLGHLLIQAII